MNSGHEMRREAYEALERLDKSYRSLVLELPLLFRVHGVGATLGYLANAGQGAASADPGVLVNTFVNAFNHVYVTGSIDLSKCNQMPIAGQPLSDYLVSSRLVLQFADVWAELARVMFEPDSPESPNDSESAQSPAARTEG